MAVKNILFDLDGTIIDSQEGIVDSIAQTLEKININIPSHKELKSLIGPPLIETLHHHFHLKEKQALEALSIYRKFYVQNGIHKYTMYNLIDQVLVQLYQRGFQLFISTGKTTCYAQEIIEELALDHLFIEVAGSNLDNTRTTKKEVINHLISTHKLNANECIIVGDRKYDILGGRECNLRATVGVTYGFGERKELEDAKADFIIENCSELLPLINDQFAV